MIATVRLLVLCLLCWIGLSVFLVVTLWQADQALIENRATIIEQNEALMKQVDMIRALIVENELLKFGNRITIEIEEVKPEIH